MKKLIRTGVLGIGLAMASGALAQLPTHLRIGTDSNSDLLPISSYNNIEIGSDSFLVNHQTDSSVMEREYWYDQHRVISFTTAIVTRIEAAELAGMNVTYDAGSGLFKAVDGDYDVAVYNVSGIECCRFTITAGESVSTDQLRPGLYIAVISATNGDPKTKSIKFSKF